MYKIVIYALRHLATAKNRSKIFVGRDNESILPDEAFNLGAYRPAATVLIAYSTLLRCKQTVARLISNWTLSLTAPMTLSLQPMDQLVERHLGDWQGRQKSAVLSEFKERVKNGILDPLITPPNGETFDCFNTRVVSAIRELCMCEEPDTDIIICTHVHVLRVIYAFRKGINPVGIWEKTTFDHGALTRI